MAAFSPLIEFLLAYRRPDGARICSYGAVSAIAIIPANLTITFDVYPRWGFADILIYYKETPSLVPEALQMDSWSEGLQIQLGPITTILMAIDTVLWQVVTQDQPIHTTVVNRTNLVQREDWLEAFLIVQSENDYKFVLALIRDWCTNYRVSMELERQTLILEEMAKAQGVILPEPRLPIGGG